MLPRPSTTISLQPWSATPLRSACLTIDPALSLRRSSWPVTSRRPSGSHSVAHPRPGGPCPTTSLLPSRSTAMISWVPQLENHRRPACQRGDSPIARPVSKLCGSDIETSLRHQHFHVRLLEPDYGVGGVTLEQGRASETTVAPPIALKCMPSHHAIRTVSAQIDKKAVLISCISVRAASCCT